MRGNRSNDALPIRNLPGIGVCLLVMVRRQTLSKAE